jgi:hypothetical protein
VTNPLTDGLEVLIRRTGSVGGTNQYWNWATRAWETNPTSQPQHWQLLDATDAVSELTVDAIPVDSITQLGETAHYDVFVGRRQAAPGAATFIVGVVSKQLGGVGYGNSYGQRPSLAIPISPATITRVADEWTMPNDGSNQFWFRDRGTCLLEFRPMYRAASMPTGIRKPLIRAQNVGSGYDEVTFIAGPDRIVFARVNDTLASTVLTVNIPALPGGVQLSRDHVVRVFAKWNDDEGSQQEAPRQMNLRVAIFDAATGDFIVDDVGTAAGLVPDGSPDEVHLGHSGLGTEWADVYIRTFEVKRNPVWDEEAVWRR